MLVETLSGRRQQGLIFLNPGTNSRCAPATVGQVTSYSRGPSLGHFVRSIDFFASHCMLLFARRGCRFSGSEDRASNCHVPALLRSLGPAPMDLLTFAGDVVIPIHERTVGVVPPSPDVQFEMCWQAVSVRAANELERLPLKHRRTGVMRQPGV